MWQVSTPPPRPFSSFQDQVYNPRNDTPHCTPSSSSISFYTPPWTVLLPLDMSNPNQIHFLLFKSRKCVLLTLIISTNLHRLLYPSYVFLPFASKFSLPASQTYSSLSMALTHKVNATYKTLNCFVHALFQNSFGYRKIFFAY